MSNRRIYLIFFLGLTLLYLSLSPGEVWNMGYTKENIKASNEILSNLGDWISFRIADSAVTWPRHGILELIFEMPFLLLDRVFSSATREWNDRFLSLQPIIVTSLLCTLIFAWVHRITSSLVWAYVLAMVAAFSTMLWPYAYIGLETTQSLALMFAAYLSLGNDPSRTWPRTLAFAFACAMAISLKTNSIFLLPAVAYLIYSYFKRGSFVETVRSLRQERKAFAVVAIILTLYSINAYTRSLAQAWHEGFVTAYLRDLRVDGPISYLLSVFSFFGSPNKGLLIYCPVVIMCLALLHKAYTVNTRLVVFAILAVAGLVGGCSLFFFWSEETWGPRYLHSTIGPLIVCFAAARVHIRFCWRREFPLLALATWGVAVSFLGVFFYYGTLHLAATRAISPTIEAFQHEPDWNHIRFNAKLLQEWAHGSRPGEQATAWPPPRVRWYPAQGEKPLAYPQRTINLQDYANPQPLLFRNWTTIKGSSLQFFWYVCVNCCWFGLALLLWLSRLVARGAAPEQSNSKAEEQVPR